MHVDPRTAGATWLSAGAGAQVRVQVAAWFSLVAVAEAQVESSRPQLAIAGIGPFGRQGLFALRLSLGTEWIL